MDVYVKENSQDVLRAIEQIPDLESQIKEQMISMFRFEPVGFGSCHAYWAAKKTLLREKYGIEWFSPAEENPNVLYD